MQVSSLKRNMMPESPLVRKDELPFGKQKEIAQKAGVSESYVSRVARSRFTPTTPRGWRKYRTVQVLIARALGRRVDEVFPPAQRQTEAA